MDEVLAGIKIARRNISNFRNADNATLTAESEKELKSPLIKVKEETEKTDLKLNLHFITTGLLPGHKCCENHP